MTTREKVLIIIQIIGIAAVLTVLLVEYFKPVAIRDLTDLKPSKAAAGVSDARSAVTVHQTSNGWTIFVTVKK